MISSVYIKGFMCFQEVEVDFDPLTVLVGPNDSGKTAFLRAIQLATTQTVSSVPTDACSREFGLPVGRDAVWRRSEDIYDIELYGTLKRSEEHSRSLRFRYEHDAIAGRGFFDKPNPNMGSERPFADQMSRNLAKDIGQAQYYRLDPRALREPTGLVQRMTESGLGLPGFLFTVAGLNPETFKAIGKAFSEWFPEYELIVGNIADAKGKVGFRTRFGDVAPECVSDGVMLSLAFLALANQPEEHRVLLIEEPENGVHHARLKDIVATLRGLTESGKTQVILTTHSPYLLDFVKPEEVRVFSKDEEGAAHAVKLSDVPDVASWRKHFNAGEIWTSVTEEELVKRAGAK